MPECITLSSTKKKEHKTLSDCPDECFARAVFELRREDQNEGKT